MIFPAIFGLITLILLFLKLPAAAEAVGFLHCQVCAQKNPYLVFIGAAYFSAFTATILCFPSLPKRSLKCAGLIWAIGLAIVLIYLSPTWCFLCLSAHACHILMWIFWKPTQDVKSVTMGIKLAIIFTAAIAVTALFSTLNFTFLIYKADEKDSVAIPFELDTLSSEHFSQYPTSILPDQSGMVMKMVAKD